MDIVETIRTEADALLKLIIETYSLDVKEEENVYHIVIKTDEAPTLIGRHGETIRALQKILEVVLYKKTQSSVHLLINVNDYREKQQEKLELMANQYAEKVTQSRQPEYVSYLTSFERRIIHKHITENYPELTSYSVGEGKARQLVVDLKENEPKQENTEA